MSELLEALSEEVLPEAPWEAIAPHYARGVVLCVDGVSLVDVGATLVRDDVEAVEAMLASGVLRRPADDDAQAWTDSEATFDILIVDPWVLLRQRGS